MGDKTGISWSEATWNPLVGCQIKSAGCKFCYAMKDAHRLSKKLGVGKYDDLTFESAGGQILWNGKVRLWEPALDQPLRWGRPRLIFTNSMSDLFYEEVQRDWQDSIVAVMALSMLRRHEFQTLTKRPDVMQRYLCDPETPERVANEMARIMLARQGANGGKGVKPARTPAHLRPAFPLPNCWWGISAEDQETYEEREPFLCDTPGAIRFISYEPAIGPLRLKESTLRWLDWIIVGGESGDGARPFDLQWARDIIAQCAGTRVKVYVKQLGSKPIAGLLPYPSTGKGDRLGEWPEGLKVQHFPRPAPHVPEPALL
jgi:protein gp37